MRVGIISVSSSVYEMLELFYFWMEKNSVRVNHFNCYCYSIAVKIALFEILS